MNYDYEKIRTKCIKKACAWGFEQESEDFAQDYCIRIFQGYKQTIAQAWIDYLRKHVGKTRYEKYIYWNTKTLDNKYDNFCDLSYQFSIIWGMFYS